MDSNGSCGKYDWADFPQDVAAYSVEVEELISGRSALEPSAEDVVNGENGEALARLIDFMECRGYLHVLRFWLETQHFVRLLPDTGKQEGDGDVDDCVEERDGERYECTEKRFADVRLVRDPEVAEKALRIFNQYLAHDSPDAISVDEDLRRQVLERMCQEDGSVDLGCFAPAQQWAWDLIKNRFYGQFLRSHQFLLYKSDFVLGDRVTLADLCSSAHALSYLLEFAESTQSWFGDALRFLLSAVHCQRSSSLNPSDFNNAFQDASVIFHKYFSKSSAQVIPLDDKIRNRLEDLIHRRDASATCTVFQETIAHVYVRLAQTCLGEFFRSEPFMRYLVHLDACLKTAMTESGVHTAASAKKLPRWKSQEQCTEQVFWETTRRKPPVETQSLSGADRWTGKPSRLGTDRSSSVCADSDGDISVSASASDTAAHPPLKKLTLGQVDSLGRFVSFAEAEPSAPADRLTLFHKYRKKKVQMRKDEEALVALEAQRIIEDTLQQVAPSVL